MPGGRNDFRVTGVIEHHDVEGADVRVRVVDGIGAQRVVCVKAQNRFQETGDLQPNVLTRRPLQSLQSWALQSDAAHPWCQVFDLADGCGQEHRVAQRVEQRDSVDERCHEVLLGRS
jgi:hypothetical protein